MTADEASRYERLPREEVIKAVERRNPRRVPLVMARWWGQGLADEYGQRLEELSRYPEDARFIGIPTLDVRAMGLSWDWSRQGGHDSGGVLDDWSRLDEFVDKLPDPSLDPLWDELAEQTGAAHRENAYLIVGWWGLFFETPWGLRGMENLLADYYEHAEEIHRLHQALAEFYCRSIRKAAAVMRPDGFWASWVSGRASMCST